jgi:hypothetical protein
MTRIIMQKYLKRLPKKKKRKEKKEKLCLNPLNDQFIGNTHKYHNPFEPMFGLKWERFGEERLKQNMKNCIQKIYLNIKVNGSLFCLSNYHGIFPMSI